LRKTQTDLLTRLLALKFSLTRLKISVGNSAAASPITGLLEKSPSERPALCYGEARGQGE
jgi:hypothetical protein